MLFAGQRHDLMRHILAGGEVADMDVAGALIGEVRRSRALPAERIEHEEAIRTVRTGNHPAEADEGVVVDRLDIDLDTRRQLFLPRRALYPRDGSVRCPVVLPVQPEVVECPVAGRDVAVHEVRRFPAHQCHQQFGGAELLDRSLDARRGFRHRGRVQIPLVAERDALGGQLLSVRRVEVAEEILLVRHDDLPVGRGLALGDKMEVLDQRIPFGIGCVGLTGLAVERVPAEAERAADAVGLRSAGRAVAAQKTGVGVEKPHRGHGIERLGVSAAAAVAAGASECHFIRMRCPSWPVYQ
jgi:hypothetical protein